MGKPGGRALLVVKGADGKWHGPAFYNIETVAQGFKPGIKVATMVALVMTTRPSPRSRRARAMLGTDLMAVAGRSRRRHTDPAADVSRTPHEEGRFSVVNVGGVSIRAFNDWNAAFYNSPSVQAGSILEGKTTSRDAVALLAAVTRPPAARLRRRRSSRTRRSRRRNPGYFFGSLLATPST